MVDARGSGEGDKGAREHACALDRIAHAGASRSFLVVAAHPDDETIGVGVTLGSLAARGSRVRVLHVTDGAPRNPALRPTLRDRSPAEAAAVRRAELASALRAGGLDPGAVLAPSLGVPDQDASLVLVDVARAIARELAASAPDVVITHPYEGGHPDHDAVAFAVHAAARMHAGAPIAIAEMSSYHAWPEREAIETARFLDAASPCPLTHEGLLDAPARERKRAMLDAFASQSEVLASFGTAAEPLRCAPAYDFTRAPHAGTLHYERLEFGWTGERWRALAEEALVALSIGVPTRRS
jgi:LmbE family N-acetylglucosaminyl deacetylase